MNSDFKDLLRLLHEEKVEYLIAGGYAVIYHSQPRYTKDLDIWIKPSPEKAWQTDASVRLIWYPTYGSLGRRFFSRWDAA